MGWVHFPSSFTVFYGATILKDDTPMSQKYEMTRVSSLKKGNIFHVPLFFTAGEIYRMKTLISTQKPLFSIRVSRSQQSRICSFICSRWCRTSSSRPGDVWV